MDKRYRKMKEGWEKPLEKKRLRRARLAEVKALEVRIMKNEILLLKDSS